MDRLTPSSLAPAILAVTTMFVVYGAIRAWHLRWVCDDAFISFRYAQNLVDGYGLVWNVSERVEGYTNLLWTLLIAAGMRTRLDPVKVSWGLGLVAWALCALALYRLERRDPPTIPVGTWLFVISPDVQTWATGGLETMALAAALAATALAARAGWLWAASLLAGVDWWLHPDAILPATVMLIGFGIERHGRSALRALVGPLALLAACVAATTVWRVGYYGDWLPNTFYAKSAGEPWLSQGLWYATVFFWRNWAAAIVIVIGSASLVASALRARRLPPAAITAAGGFSFLFYVVYSGGDFMQARRLVPALPLLLAPASGALGLRGSIGAAAGLLFAAGAALPWPVFAHQPRIGGVADERAFYAAEIVALRRSQGLELAEMLRGLETPVLIEGGLCMLAFYSHLDDVIEINGLTDSRLARLPLSQRGIPGHEKRPTEQYLDERGVELVVLHAPAATPQPLDVAVLPRTHLAVRLRHYVPAIVDTLAARGARVLDSAALIEWARQSAAQRDCREVDGLMAFLDRYYFAPTGDPRRADLERQARASCRAGRST